MREGLAQSAIVVMLLLLFALNISPSCCAAGLSVAGKTLIRPCLFNSAPKGMTVMYDAPNPPPPKSVSRTSRSRPRTCRSIMATRMPSRM